MTHVDYILIHIIFHVYEQRSIPIRLEYILYHASMSPYMPSLVSTLVGVATTGWHKLEHLCIVAKHVLIAAHGKLTSERYPF